MSMSMKAVQYDTYGEAKNVLKIVQNIPRPQLAHRNHVLVRVHFSSINPIDYKLRSGHLRALLSPDLPLVPGFDFAGVLVEVHPESQCPWPIGSWVCGMKGLLGVREALPGFLRRRADQETGTWAEYVRLDWTRTSMGPIPAYLPPREAGGVGIAALTAFTALRDHFHLRTPADARNKVVLILGASGGVGTFAVQMAHRVLQLTTVCVCSGRNAKLVRELGGTVVVDYTKGPSLRQLVQEAGYGMGSLDGILDLVGGDVYYRELAPLLKPRSGQFVTATGPTSSDQSVSIWGAVETVYKMSSRWLGSWFGWSRAYSFISQLPQHNWSIMMKEMEQHQVRTIIHQEYDLSDAVAVHEQSETGRTVGKLIVRVTEPTNAPSLVKKEDDLVKV